MLPVDDATKRNPLTIARDVKALTDTFTGTTNEALQVSPTGTILVKVHCAIFRRVTNSDTLSVHSR